MSKTPTRNEHADDDAVAVLAVLFAIAGATDPWSEAPQASSIWGAPAHRIGIAPAPSATAWWASGTPR